MRILINNRNEVDIVAVTETWLNDEVPDFCLCIPGYTLKRCDRKNRKGGGVCFCYNNDINFQTYNYNIDTPFEIEVLFLMSNSHK